tara:strand:+ start:361 stop:1050 length:690 start_codon:yes stop_codon:yes gene_type:complete
MSSQKEISPIQLTNEIKKICNGRPLKEFDFQNNWSEIEKVFEMAKIMVTPKPHIHGKKCSNCHHSMHCKSIKCPNCFKEQRKRKRQVPAIPQAPPEAAPVIEEVILETTKWNSNMNGDTSECAICHGKKAQIRRRVISMSYVEYSRSKPRHCRHKYCGECILPQLEHNIMKCDHCRFGAIRRAQNLKEHVIERHEWSKRHCKPCAKSDEEFRAKYVRVIKEREENMKME